MAIKHRKPVRIILSLIAILLIVAAAFCGICVYLVFQDNIQNQYMLTETSDTFMSTLLKGAVFGKQFEMSETEINSYINDIDALTREKHTHEAELNIAHNYW